MLSDDLISEGFNLGMGLKASGVGFGLSMGMYGFRED